MPYKVYKMSPDRRNHTCGFFIPNGGFYHVVEMTFENAQQLQNLSGRPGYSVDFVDGPVGFYDAEGYEVDESSVEVDAISKIVQGYEKKMKKYGGKETAKKVSHKGTERDAIIQQAASMGLQVKGWESTQTIKTQLSQSGRPRQATLAVT